jgi:fibronectin-binding autotransporter adhesin
MKLRRLFGQRWLSALTLLAFVFLILAPASALPEGPTVIHGNIKVMTAGQLQQILQSSSQGIINWSSFGIGPNEIVRIIQPNSASVLLNRVTGMDPSLLQGMLQANGRIFLVNPNGILFGPNSKVDAGSFFATTLGISDQDFLKGNYNFSQNAQGQLAAIVNQGEIRVGDGGFIVLAAPLVHNDGLIVARQGSVNLAATQQATLQLDPQGSFQVIVPDGFKPTFSDPVKNGEAVLLQRGQVTDILSSVIKSGVFQEATSFEDTGSAVVARNSSGLALNSGQIVVDGNPGQAAGRIRIDSERASVQTPTGVLSAVGHHADAGDIRVVSNGASITAGAVDASATGTGHGGFVELSGRTLSFGQGVQVGSELGYAGTVLLDPVDLVIVPTAGSLDGSLPTIGNATGGPISHTLSATSLNSITSGNVILNATRDILYQTATANISLPSAVNLSVSAGRNLTFQSTGATSLLGISAGNISLEAGQDLTLQGRYGVLINATNGDAALTAGRNLSVQYYNPGFAGGSNPRRVMALAATGNVNLTAGNNLVFATNNNIDGLSGAPNITSILSTSGNVSLTAGQDAFIGVSLNSTKNANVVAGSNLTINPINISVAEASPNMTGNLNIQANNVAINTDLVVAGTANITSTSDLAIRQASPTLTVGNLNLNAGRNLTIQATAATGMVNISSNVLNLTATNDLAIQGRYGVNVSSNSTADLRAGSNLSVQYFNPGFAGGANPRRVMALTATGDVNLTAGNNLVFSTNNSIDGLSGAPNITTIRSTGGSIAVNAGQDASIGVSLNSTRNANVLAGRNLTLLPINITVAEASPTMAGNLNLQANNVTINTDLTVNGTANISTTSDLALRHASPTLTVGNLNLNAGRNLTIQATDPTGMVNISSNVLNLTATNDLAIQGRYGVNITSNTTADLRAGSNLSVQYFNPGFAGGANPRRVMTLAATGDVNLTAGNNLVFSTNNTVDGLSGAPNTTTIRSTTGSIAVNAGQDASIGVSLNSTRNANVVAGRNLTFLPINITVAEASPTLAGNLNLQANNVTINTDLAVNGTANITTAGDLAIRHGSPTLTVGNLSLNAGRNLTIQATAPTGMVNISSNVLNLTATNDLAIQGRYGVNVSSNTTADLRAGSNLSVQYYNPGFAGGANPRRVMTLAAAGDVNLTAGNNLVFSTNNTVDGLSGAPNITTIRSNSGSIVVNAGQDASIGVSLNSTRNANVLAGRNLTVLPINITVAEASPTLAGNLNLQANNVTINTDLIVNGTANITTAGDLAIRHASPTLTVGNLNLNAGRNLTIQATAPTGMVNISSNVLNLTAANDLAIQGRYGVNVSSNTTADLRAGSNLSVQYFNPGGAGGANPRRVMALNATGDVNLTAGNNLVVATNNTVDGLDGAPNVTSIRSTSGTIAINAGQDASIGVSLNSTKNANVTAGRNLTINPINITVAEASPTLAGNLNLQANNVTINTDLIVNGTANITTTGDLAIRHGSPTLTVGNLSLNAGRNLTIQATAPTGMVNISSNVLNLTAANDLAIQGRYGVNISSNTTADLRAGSNLSVQYFNPGGAGGSNPRRVMALTAPGDVNLTAGNNLVFATNNNVDGLDGVPNVTRINSQNGSVTLNAGRDIVLGVSTNSSVNDNLIAGGTINVGAFGISGPEATTNTTGNLSLAANALNISAPTPLSAQGALTLNISSGINLTSDLNSAQGLTLISNNSISGNGRNVTSSNGVVNLTVFGNGNLTFNNSNLSGSNGVAIQNLGNGTASVTASNLVSSQGIAAISTGNGGLSIDRSSLNSTSGNVSLRNSGTGPVQLSNSAVTATNVDILNSGNGTLSVSNSSFSVSNTLTAQNQGGGRLNFTGSNVVAGESVSLSSNGGNTQVDNSTFNTTSLTLLNSGTSNFSSQGSKFLSNTSVAVQNQGSGALNLSAANINAGQGVVLNSTSSGASSVTGSNVRGQTLNVTSTAAPWSFSNSNLNSVGALSIASQGSGVNATDTNITSSNGPLGIKSAPNSSVVLGNSTRVISTNGSVTIDSGGNLLAGPQSTVRGANVTLKAPGTITVGILNASNAVINSTGGNVIVDTMSKLNGGNFSIYTPLALLENTPVSPTANLSPLQSLTLDVGNIFGNATLTSPFSVVNSSTIDILITAPNDPSRGKAAELRTLGGAIPVVRRGPNAGAIFLDGVELFLTPALQPVLGITRREDLDDSQQVELIQQLAQCNLGLGNKSGTAYFVQSEDRMQVPYNSEGLSGSYFDFPMAITLEHIAELDPKSLLEQAKADGAVARATNVMNAQEQQEAWELRYWSNFIERIILWGDDE